MENQLLDKLLEDCDCAYATDKIHSKNWVGTCGTCQENMAMLSTIVNMIDFEKKKSKI